MLYPLSFIYTGALLHYHPCLPPPLSRVYDDSIVILKCLLCILNHIILHLPAPFTDICLYGIFLWHVSTMSLPPPFMALSHIYLWLLHQTCYLLLHCNFPPCLHQYHCLCIYIRAFYRWRPSSYALIILCLFRLHSHNSASPTATVLNLYCHFRFSSIYNMPSSYFFHFISCVSDMPLENYLGMAPLLLQTTQFTWKI